MKFPFREIPPGLKMRPSDFFVYTRKKQEPGYPVQKHTPTMFGRLIRIDKTSTGFTRYVMVKFVPNQNKLRRAPISFIHYGHRVVEATDDYILVARDLPPGWFGVPIDHRYNGVTEYFFDRVAEIAPKGLWVPYRPDDPSNKEKCRNYPWGIAFRLETDAVLFQALIDMYEQNDRAGV